MPFDPGPGVPATEAGDSSPLEVLESIFERHDHVMVAALGRDGRRVPLPASVRYPGQVVIPLPDHEATIVDLVVPADRLVVVEIWERAMASGLGAGSVRLLTVPGRRMNLTFVAAHGRYGVWLALLVDEGAVVEGRRDVLPEMLVIPTRPRSATLSKRMTGEITAIGPGVTRMLGWQAEELVGRRSTDFIHDDDRERAIENWMDLLATKGSQRVRVRHRCRDGSWLWLEVENIYHHVEGDVDQQEIVIEARLSDISDEMAAHEALRYREELFSQLAESLPSGVVQLERDGSVVYANRRLLSVIGAAPGDLTLDGLLAVVDEADRALLGDGLARALDLGEGGEFEVGVSREGVRRRCAVSIVAVTGREGERTALACVSDITESVQLREDLRARATYDLLTGCLNRNSIMDILDAALAEGDGTDTGVVFIDLDHFKPVNDRFGHAAGDRLLAEVARRLREGCREGDVVGRIGGDEFLVVCRHLANPATELAAVADRLNRVLRRPATLEGVAVEVTASFGVARSEPGMSSDHLVSRADQAMYLAKQRPAGPVLR